jgi:hypothetical protein
MALDRVQYYYPESQAIVIAYHYSDSYSISYVNSRTSYYGITSYPTVMFNGISTTLGGYPISNGETGIQYMYNWYTGIIRSELARTANNNPFDITLRGQISPTNSVMTAYISTTTGYPKTVNAIFLITENAIPVSASNGQTILNAVARGYLGTRSFTMTSSGSTTLNASIGSIPNYNGANLQPVIILQDSSTKEIIGAVTEFTLPTSVPSQWQLYN